MAAGIQLPPSINLTPDEQSLVTEIQNDLSKLIADFANATPNSTTADALQSISNPSSGPDTTRSSGAPPTQTKSKKNRVAGASDNDNDGD